MMTFAVPKLFRSSGQSLVPALVFNVSPKPSALASRPMQNGQWELTEESAMQCFMTASSRFAGWVGWITNMCELEKKN